MSQLQGYGYVSDSDESLKSKSGAKFGGNFGVAVLAKFAYSANVAKEGQEPREAIEVVVKVGDREYKDWINPVNRVVDKNNAEIQKIISDIKISWNIYLQNEKGFYKNGWDQRIKNMKFNFSNHYSLFDRDFYSVIVR